VSADLSQQRTQLPPQYTPGEVEDRLYQSWDARGLMHADPKDVSPEHPAFCVVIPPPNVTGSLHIGHALNHTLIDALVRRRRMQGYTTLWVPGMDHAGIATQNVVERELAKEGLSRHDLGREAFVERVWQWKAESGGKILGQMRRLGDSVDWSRERFTMDEGLSRAVQTVFKRLFDDGLIYRAERIINWCPRCLTALSDIEVDHSDEDGELVSIRYGDGDDSVVVATTRAETMLGDTAVAVHPDDARYAHLVGRDVQLPLSNRRIPVVADPHVDPEFGTGAVKVTPAHDPDDFEIGRRHGLRSITVLDEHGRITAHGPFEGLDRFEARPAVVRALREDGRIVAEVRPYVHAVGHCSRCGTVVEPRLSLQWFVKVGPLAKAAGDAVRDGRVGIHPAEMAPRYFDWVDDMHDWCISRQLWWGHRIPVWYGPSGEVVCTGPGEDPPSGEGWRQDPDVLDTWFSSALWPCSTLGWPDDTEDLAAFYPTSVLVTAYDILFFWVARMMMFGLYVMSDREPAQAVPFRDIALHGLVRDAYGKKMSKSLGNTVDPLDWIGRFGADATRFTLARGASPGSDVAISEEWVTGSRNFCNKLWNAARFALLNGATVPGMLPDPGQMPTAARWILSRLATVTAEVDALFERYEFGKVCELLYHFAWDEVCDWYLELAKPALSGSPAGQAGSASPAGQAGSASPAGQAGSASTEATAQVTREVLGYVLDRLLKLLHPVMPFVTEELWTALTGGDTLMVAPWPGQRPAVLAEPASPAAVTDDAAGFRDAAAEAEIGSLMRLVTEVRRFRSDQGLRPGQQVPAVLAGIEGSRLAPHQTSIRSLLRLTAPGDGFTATASVLAEGITVELDTAAGIDVAAERRRMDKDLAAARKEADQAERKLANESFLAKAPAEVVATTRERLDAARADIERITGRLAALPGADGQPQEDA
jgi:valyl-tRNA synthetase